MSAHRAGGKFASSHTTLIGAAEEIVDAAVKLSEVTKVSLGEIKVIGGGLANVKFIAVDSGFKVVVRGNTSRQYIYIYTDDADKTKRDLAIFEHKKG